MKKTKVLLPIIGLGAAAAAVTPMLVSCGNSNVITGNNVIVPTEDLANITSQLTIEQANREYAKEIAENPNIFVQDWRFDASFKTWWLKEIQRKEHPEFKEPEFKISANFKNIEVKQQTIQRWDGQFDEGMTISYELNSNIFVDAKDGYIISPAAGDTYGYTIRKADLNIKAKLVSCPYLIDRIKDDPHKPYIIGKTGWNIFFKSGYLTNLPWTIEITADGYYYGEAESEIFKFKNETYTYDVNHPLPIQDSELWSKQAYLWGTYDSLFGTIDYIYHFQNVDHAIEP